jgi:hypothetical protein
MSLVRLLWTTTSLSEAKDQPHRFKMRYGLPTFGHPTAVKNFEVRTSAPNAVLESDEKAMKTETLNEQAAPVDQNVFPRGRWAARTPFKSDKASARPVVQGELSLEKVKPVRNDLSDSDLELVQASRRVEPKAASPFAAPESVDVAAPATEKKTVWSRVLTALRRK